MKKISLKRTVVSTLLLIMIGILSVNNSIYAAVPLQNPSDKPAPQQEFSSKLGELKAKAKAFTSNAQSFHKMLEGMDERDVEKKQKTLETVIDSMLDNNKELQDLTKTLADNETNQKIKNFYNRDILPNLQNINRQLLRIKLSAKGKINLQNMTAQAERTAESIQQVVDRINNYEGK
jgi:hypothetical protein